MSIDTAAVRVEKDVVYGPGGGRDLLCDVYRPDAAVSNRTAVLQLHGGGFRGGSKEGARVALRLAGLGYTGIAAQYRLTAEAKWPAQLDDVQTALGWIKRQADALDVDADKVVILGHSAGAIMALCSAARLQGQVAACVAFYPAAEQSRSPDGALPEPLAADADQRTIESLNPIGQVAAGFPPTLLLHGAADTTFAPSNSLRLFDALTSVGAPAELHVFEGLAHVFDNHAEFAELSSLMIDLFLDRHVVNPRTYSQAMGRPAAPQPT